MTSDGERYAERADESLHAGELRTANLLAVAADVPILRDTWGRPTALPPEVLVEQIRAELDMPTEGSA